MARSNDSVPVFRTKSAKSTSSSGGALTVDLAAASLPATGRQHDPVWSPTRVFASSDKAATVTVESPAGTILWQEDFSGAFAMEAEFDPGDYPGASASELRLKVSDSTALVSANLTAAAIPNTAGKVLLSARTI